MLKIIRNKTVTAFLLITLGVFSFQNNLHSANASDNLIVDSNDILFINSPEFTFSIVRLTGVDNNIDISFHTDNVNQFSIDLMNQLVPGNYKVSIYSSNQLMHSEVLNLLN